MSETLEQSAKRAWLEVYELRKERDELKAMDSVSTVAQQMKRIGLLEKWRKEADNAIAELEKERDELKTDIQRFEDWIQRLENWICEGRNREEELAAQNVALRSALSWAERNMDAETLAQFESEDDCHCPFCEVATPNLAESVLKRRDAEIAAKEREACAKVCEEKTLVQRASLSKILLKEGLFPCDIATAIRARSNEGEAK